MSPLPDDLVRADLLARHIFGEPDRAAGINRDADANLVKSRAEKMDAVPASKRLVSHTFLNGGHAAPGSRIWACLGNILSAVAHTGKTFIRNTLVRRHTIGTKMAEAAVNHVPAMEQCAG